MTVADNLIALACSRDILSEAKRLGADLKPIHRNAGEHVGPCPVCGGKDRFSINTKKRVWHCRGCGRGGDIVDLVRHLDSLSFAEAIARLTNEMPEPERQGRPAEAKPASDDEARNLRSAARIVAELVPVKGSAGETYLRKVRKIDTAAIADVLARVDAIGWHRAVYFHQLDPEKPYHELHGRKLGALIGIMTDPVTAKLTGAISRTYLGADGAKVGKAKTLAAPAGIVRLSRDEDVLGGLHLAEGIESGLCALSLGFRPLWVTGSTSLMRVFPLLGGIERLSILADRDANGAGENAAKVAACRWREAGRDARIRRLSQGLGDVNDAEAREWR